MGSWNQDFAVKLENVVTTINYQAKNVFLKFEKLPPTTLKAQSM